MLLFLASGLMAGAQDSDSPTYTRTEQLGAVRLRYEDLLSVLDTGRSLADIANGPTSDRTEQLSIDSGRSVIEIEQPPTNDLLRGAPDLAFTVRYLLYDRKAPISQIGISLNDYARELTVSGTSQAQVDAAALALRAKLTTYETWLAGPNIRIFGLMGLYLFSWLLVTAGIPISKNWAQRSLVGVLALFGFTAPFVFPWGSWLAGTSIVKDSASPLQYYSAEISVFGVFLSVAVPLATVVWSALDRLRLAGSRPEVIAAAPVAPAPAPKTRPKKPPAS